MSRFDLISLGEVMLRMSPPRYERLRRARSLDIQVAGAQLNIAANLARFGKKAAFISKLPHNELGLLAYDMCQSYGVDMAYVQLVEGARMGVNYLEFTATPRTPVTIFDRKDSAASTITANDFDWQSILADVKIAHTDGIFPGLSVGCREATTIYLETAKALGGLTSFDMNYREHLWTVETARECWNTLLPMIDIVVTNRSVSELAFGFSGSDEALLRQYHEAFGCKLICLTSREIDGIMRGAWASQALYEGEVIYGRRYEFDAVDRYGTGDAFFAGLLYGYLEGDVQFALNFGNAACALAHTVEGDVAHISVAEVRPLLGDTIDLRVKR
jgi:2-dehydro-3-deoxygluconokinase